MVDVSVHRRLLFCVEKKESAFDFRKRDCDREISGVSESRLGPRKFLSRVLTRFKFKKSKRSRFESKPFDVFIALASHMLLFFYGYIYLIFPV
jgi:hypothetical protein